MWGAAINSPALLADQQCADQHELKLQSNNTVQAFARHVCDCLFIHYTLHKKPMVKFSGQLKPSLPCKLHACTW